MEEKVLYNIVEYKSTILAPLVYEGGWAECQVKCNIF